MNRARIAFEALRSDLVEWQKTSCSDYVFEAQFRDDIVNLRLNDFPDEPICSLIVGDDSIHLEELPVGWLLPKHRDE